MHQELDKPLSVVLIVYIIKLSFQVQHMDDYIICIVQADNASRVLFRIILFILLDGGFNPSGGILSTTIGKSCMGRHMFYTG